MLTNLDVKRTEDQSEIRYFAARRLGGTAQAAIDYVGRSVQLSKECHTAGVWLENCHWGDDGRMVRT